MCIRFPKILDTQLVKNSQLKLYSSQKPVQANFNNEIKSDLSGTVYYGVEFRCNLTFPVVKPLTFHLLPVINWKFHKRWLINIR